MLPRRDSAILGRWNVAAREIRRFLSGGWFLRVEFCNFRAVDDSSAWDSAISERWNVAAREILRFPSGGWFLRVEFRDS